MPRGLEGFEKDAASSVRYFEAHGIGIYARLLREAAGVMDAALPAWHERDFQAFYERPLLLCAALRFGALLDATHPLARAIGEGPPAPALVTSESIAAALARTDTQEALARRYVQTNEVTRAVAWRLALGCVPLGPVAIADLGCSAALNCVADRIALSWTDAAGAPLVLATTERVAHRLGLDRRPIDARDALERTWLRACVWPGQDDRLARLDAALEAASLALERGELRLAEREAVDFPAELDLLPRDAFTLAFQSVFAEYLPPDARAAYDGAMLRWLASRPRAALWVTFETAPPPQERARVPRAGQERPRVPRAVDSPGPVEIRAHMADGSFLLGTCEYHPTSVTVHEAALGALRERLRLSP
jgi:hypothetical protein